MARPPDIRQDPRFDQFTSAIEEERGLPSGLIRSLVSSESSGNPDAVSPVGARGLTQFMPATAQQYNVDVTNPWDSIRGTGDYLYDLQKKYNGNIEAALSHYNGGAHNAQFFVDGTVPGKDKVSAKNHEINKGYVSGILNRVQSNAGVDPAQIEKAVADMYAAGEGAYSIVGKLKKMGLGPTIEEAQKKNYSATDIVKRIGGEALAPYLKAEDTVENESGLTTFAKQTGQVVDNKVRGVQQIVAGVKGDTAREAALRSQQRAVEADPLYRARSDTFSGAAAKVVPAVVGGGLAAAATGGASIPLQIGAQVAAGALDGATDATTGDGQRFDNTLNAAGTNLAGAGVGALVGKGVGLVGRGAQSAMRNGEDVASIAARKQFLASEGIDAPASLLTGRAASASNAIENNIVGSTWLGAGSQAAKTDAQIARAVTRRIGNEQGVIDSNTLNGARAATSKLYDDALAGVKVDMRGQVGAQLDQVVADYQRSVLPSMQNSMPSNLVSDLKNLAGQGPMDATTLQGIRSSIGKELRSPAMDPNAKQALGAIYTKIDDVIQTQLPPSNLEKFLKANDQYRHMQPIKKMIKASGDSGNVTSKQMLNAIKSGQYSDDFTAGRAPFQDLVDALMPAAQAPTGKGALGKVGAGLVGHAALGPGALAAPVVGNGAFRALNNPAYADKILGLSGAAVGPSLVGTGAMVAQPARPEPVMQQNALAAALSAQAQKSVEAAGLAPQPQQAPRPNPVQTPPSALASALQQKSAPAAKYGQGMSDQQRLALLMQMAQMKRSP